VAWNCVAKFYVIQNPPGAANWAIGDIGDRLQTARYFDREPILPEGIFDSHGTNVAPQSLYLAQLQARRGKNALKNIGYSKNAMDEFPNKSVPRLQEFAMDANKMLGENLALHRPTNPNSVRNNSREFAGEKSVDGDANTYWAASGTNNVALELDMEGPVDINAFSLSEAAGMTGRIQQYRVEGQVNSDWKLLSQGTTIGDRKVDRFPATTVWKVKVTILNATDYPTIREFGLYFDENDPSARK
ncbi:MAG TPA: discoidin domain-containing protein, partial [Candidatus Baltobacteraceae bacterium]|nr:discoidin domain-containing protein [Candidatus Baltobacteraceae bacterium]